MKRRLFAATFHTCKNVDGKEWKSDGRETVEAGSGGDKKRECESVVNLVSGYWRCSLCCLAWLYCSHTQWLGNLVCVSVCVKYNSTAENYLAGGWRLSAAWKEPPFSSLASYPSLGCALRLKWQVEVITVCVCECVVACLLYVIMCARSVGAKAVCTHCSGISLPLDAPLWLHFLFMNAHILKPPNSCFYFLFHFLSLSSLSMKSLSNIFNMPASPFSFFSPHSSLCVSWALISIVHVLPALPEQSRYLHFKWEIYFSDMQINGCELCIYSGLLTQQQDLPKQTRWKGSRMVEDATRPVPWNMRPFGVLQIWIDVSACILCWYSSSYKNGPPTYFSIKKTPHYGLKDGFEKVVSFVGVSICTRVQLAAIWLITSGP